MQFRTKILIDKADFEISHDSQICLFGSCFTENMGNLLYDNLFKTDVNPFGILYNPYTIAHALKLVIQNKKFDESNLIFYNGLYHSLMHHGQFSSSNSEKTLFDINSRIETCFQNLKKTDVFIFTFGTAFVYNWRETGEVVGNCHKLSDSLFERKKLTVDDILSEWKDTLNQLVSLNPDSNFIFTVSPVRHLKDGLHQNQLSKSTLLLAIDELCKEFRQAYYFPAFEILMDELRDYRFYADDMLHPSNIAVQYIWEIFKETFFTPKTKEIIKDWQPLHKMLSHKIIDDYSESAKHFNNRLENRFQDLKIKYPSLTEIDKIKNKRL